MAVIIYLITQKTSSVQTAKLLFKNVLTSLVGHYTSGSVASQTES